jgi:hypothetical protein
VQEPAWAFESFGAAVKSQGTLFSTPQPVREQAQRVENEEVRIHKSEFLISDF